MGPEAPPAGVSRQEASGLGWEWGKFQGDFGRGWGKSERQ